MTPAEKAKLACPLVPEAEIEDHYRGDVIIVVGGTGSDIIPSVIAKRMLDRYAAEVIELPPPDSSRVRMWSLSRSERRRNRFGQHDSWKSPEDRK